MKHSTTRAVCILVMSLTSLPVLSAEPSSPNFPYSERWEPLYEQCWDKSNSILTSTISTIDSTSLTDQQEANVQEFIAESKGTATTLCSCMASKVSSAIDDAGIEMSDFNIELLAQSFRFETRYPDPNVRNIFATAVIPCPDIAAAEMKEQARIRTKGSRDEQLAKENAARRLEREKAKQK